MRADMEALMARLILAEQALLDARLQISAAPKAAPLGANVHRRAQSLAKQWSFEVATYTRSANPKSIEALRWAAMEENPIRRCISDSTILQGSQPSAVPGSSTTVQRKRLGDSEEHVH